MRSDESDRVVVVEPTPSSLPSGRDARVVIAQALGASPDSAFVGPVLVQVQSAVIIITEDKARRIIEDHDRAIRNSGSLAEPLGFMLAGFSVLAVENFHALLGVSAEVIQALFVLVTAAGLVWTLLRAFRRWIAPGTTSVDDVIASLRGHSG